MREVCKYGLMKARLKQSLSDTYRACKRTGRDWFFQLLGYEKLVSRFSRSELFRSEAKEMESRPSARKAAKRWMVVWN